MADRPLIAPARMAGLCRNVAALLIAGVWRRLSADEVRDRLAGLPVRSEAAIVGGTLGALFLACLLAAQFGLLGLALLGLAVVVIVN